MLWLSVLMAICRTSLSVERGFAEVYSKPTPIPLHVIISRDSGSNSALRRVTVWHLE